MSQYLNSSDVPGYLGKKRREPGGSSVCMSLPEEESTWNPLWVYRATSGTISDATWQHNWRQIRMKWTPQYLFGNGYDSRRYWDESSCGDYFVPVEAYRDVDSYTMVHGQLATDSYSSREKRKAHRSFTCFFVALGLILVAAASIPVLLHILIPAERTNLETIGKVSSKLTLVKIDYEEDMGNTSTIAFKRLARSFGREMDELYAKSSVGGNYYGCDVREATRGSVIVQYDMLFKPESRRIPSHKELRNILYSVDRDPEDKGLGVLGDFRFRISSVRFIKSELVSREKPSFNAEKRISTFNSSSSPTPSPTAEPDSNVFVINPGEGKSFFSIGKILRIGKNRTDLHRKLEKNEKDREIIKTKEELENILNEKLSKPEMSTKIGTEEKKETSMSTPYHRSSLRIRTKPYEMKTRPYEKHSYQTTTPRSVMSSRRMESTVQHSFPSSSSVQSQRVTKQLYERTFTEPRTDATSQTEINTNAPPPTKTGKHQNRDLQTTPFKSTTRTQVNDSPTGLSVTTIRTLTSRTPNIAENVVSAPNSLTSSLDISPYTNDIIAHPQSTRSPKSKETGNPDPISSSQENSPTVTKAPRQHRNLSSTPRPQPRLQPKANLAGLEIDGMNDRTASRKGKNVTTPMPFLKKPSSLLLPPTGEIVISQNGTPLSPIYLNSLTHAVNSPVNASTVPGNNSGLSTGLNRTTPSQSPGTSVTSSAKGTVAPHMSSLNTETSIPANTNKILNSTTQSSLTTKTNSLPMTSSVYQTEVKDDVGEKYQSHPSTLKDTVFKDDFDGKSNSFNDDSSQRMTTVRSKEFDLEATPASKNLQIATSTKKSGASSKNANTNKPSVAQLQLTTSSESTLGTTTIRNIFKEVIDDRSVTSDKGKAGNTPSITKAKYRDISATTASTFSSTTISSLYSVPKVTKHYMSTKSSMNARVHPNKRHQTNTSQISPEQSKHLISGVQVSTDAPSKYTTIRPTSNINTTSFLIANDTTTAIRSNILSTETATITAQKMVTDQSASSHTPIDGITNPKTIGYKQLTQTLIPLSITDVERSSTAKVTPASTTGEYRTTNATQSSTSESNITLRKGGDPGTPKTSDNYQGNKSTIGKEEIVANTSPVSTPYAILDTTKTVSQTTASSINNGNTAITSNKGKVETATASSITNGSISPALSQNTPSNPASSATTLYVSGQTEIPTINQPKTLNANGTTSQTKPAKTSISLQTATTSNPSPNVITKSLEGTSYETIPTTVKTTAEISPLIGTKARITDSSINPTTSAGVKLDKTRTVVIDKPTPMSTTTNVQTRVTASSTPTSTMMSSLTTSTTALFKTGMKSTRTSSSGQLTSASTASPYDASSATDVNKSQSSPTGTDLIQPLTKQTLADEHTTTKTNTILTFVPTTKSVQAVSPTTPTAVASTQTLQNNDQPVIIKTPKTDHGLKTAEVTTTISTDQRTLTTIDIMPTTIYKGSVKQPSTTQGTDTITKPLKETATVTPKSQQTTFVTQASSEATTVPTSVSSAPTLSTSAGTGWSAGGHTWTTTPTVMGTSAAPNVTTEGMMEQENTLPTPTTHIRAYLNESRAVLGKALRLTWQINKVANWTFIALARKPYRGTMELIGVVSAITKAPTGGFSNIVVSANSVFNSSKATIFVDIPLVTCMEEGQYFVRVTNASGVMAEKVDDLYVYGIPSARISLPNEIVEGKWTEGITCDADLGYPPGKVIWQVKKKNEDKFSTFTSSIHEHNITTSEPCKTKVTYKVDALFDSTTEWNYASIRCAVTDTSAITSQSGLVISNTETIKFVPLSICQGKRKIFIPHPHDDCNRFISCYSNNPNVLKCPTGTCFSNATSTCIPT